MKTGVPAATLLATLIGLCPSVAPAASPDDLGKSLTPFGAIRAGNADGSIPAWDGGATKPPAGYRAGQPKVDPFASDKPLFTITAQNVGQYEAKLSAGTVAKLKAYPDWKIVVYPTHRDFNAPQYILDAAIKNARNAKLAPNGLDVVGAVQSVPFPIPENGSQAILNHVLRFRGSQIDRTDAEAILSPAGDYVLERVTTKIMFPYNGASAGADEKRDSLFYSEVLQPPRIAGEITLVRNYTDPAEEPREAWLYNPGERRVRRAPEISYDNPILNTDGLETTDDYDLFNGAIDRYDWKLVGRKEIYIPYNTYKLSQPGSKYTDVIKPSFVNPDYVRWELHRVWVVDATLKPGVRHIYGRRTTYIDEDSWQAVISDRYDTRGQLWRTATAFPVFYYEVPAIQADGYEFTDLQAHRYAVQGLHGEEGRAPVLNATDQTPDDYTPEALRRAGRR